MKSIASTDRLARIAAFRRGPGLVHALRESIAFVAWRKRNPGGTVAEWRGAVAREVTGRVTK